MEQGYRFRRIECKVCGRMVAENWWDRHARSHQISLVVGLTPRAQEHIRAMDVDPKDLEKTLEESLRIYRHLGSFIDLMMRIGILPPDFGMGGS